MDEGDEDELLFELELDDGLVDKFKPTGLKLALVKCAGKCEKYGAMFCGIKRGCE